MFTGIVEEQGVVSETRFGVGGADSVRIRASKVLEGCEIGHSLCVSGVCLTVTEISDSEFQVEVMKDTLNRTTLGSLRRGSKVNLERAIALGGRLGGHILTGHVDAFGTVKMRVDHGNTSEITIMVPENLDKYIVPRGSIGVDGISLTVVEVAPGLFTISLIPHTLAVTTLGDVRSGSRVNIEVDVFARYVLSYLEKRGEINDLESALKEGGFFDQ
ncbi:MAG: riboflavin synthase [Actinomycetota bacterium]|nr:riboflavin synthase [Actinomycetota bacterium]